MKWGRLNIFVLFSCLLATGCRQGNDLAKPTFNTNPQNGLHIQISLERAPDHANLQEAKPFAIVRYESRKLECSKVRYLDGGSVTNPIHEALATPTEDGSFVAWLDLIEPDRCAWKLTLIRFGMANEAGTLLEAAVVPETLQPLEFFCTWPGDNPRDPENKLNGECRGYHAKGMQGNTIDNTTLLLTIKDR